MLCPENLEFLSVVKVKKDLVGIVARSVRYFKSPVPKNVFATLN